MTPVGSAERDSDKARSSISTGCSRRRDARSSWADVLAYRERGDILHTNALVPLDGALERANPAFAAGRWLLSLRNASALAVLDPSQERVVWLAKGDWTGQHDPSALPDGRLLLFDNGSTGVRHETGGRSRILAVDPATADAGPC